MCVYPNHCWVGVFVVVINVRNKKNEEWTKKPENNHNPCRGRPQVNHFELPQSLIGQGKREVIRRGSLFRGIMWCENSGERHLDAQNAERKEGRGKRARNSVFLVTCSKRNSFCCC